MGSTSVLDSITAVFEAMADWLIGIIPTITGIFYTAENGLSILGTLAVIALSMSVVFLLLGFVISFFQFRAN